MMGKISTAELFTEFYASKPKNVCDKQRRIVDRPELYDYEEKIGKPFVEMTGDEIIDMISTFKNRRSTLRTDNTNRKFAVEYVTFKNIISVYRNVFEYYIDNYELIRNPLKRSCYKGDALKDIYGVGEYCFTDEMFQQVIEILYKKLPDDRAMYAECFLQMAYNGFYNARDILLLREEDVDVDRCAVTVRGKTFNVSKRCIDLMQYTNGLDTISGMAREYEMQEWRGSYIKFPAKSTQKTVVKNTEEILYIVTKRFTNIRRITGIDFNMASVFWLGFYNMIVGRVGEQEATRVIMGSGARDKGGLLVGYMEEYGLDLDPYFVRQHLICYV